MAEIIQVIGGLGNAQAEQVAEGVTFTSDSGINQEGKMALGDYDAHLVNFSNPHRVTKEQLGLDDVDNTSDADKPISTAQQQVLDKKADLDGENHLVQEQLPFISKQAEGSFITLESEFLKPAFTNLEVEGKSEQTQLTGKNLCFKMIKGANINADGIIKIADEYSLAIAKIESGMTVSFSASDYGAGKVIALFDDEPFVDSSAINGRILPSSYNSFAISEASAKYIVFRFAIDGINPQIEKGETATDYEPYCGGIPSPNPDYPQEIKSVENAKITACGKNLLPNSSKFKSVDGWIKNQDVTLSVQNDCLKAVINQAVSTPGIKNLSPLHITPGIYTASLWVKCEGGVNDIIEFPVYFEGHKNGKTFTLYSWFAKEYKKTVDGFNYYEKTFEVTDEADYAYFCILCVNPSVGETWWIKSIQLEKGDTVTDHEPYKGKTATLSDVVLRSAGEARDRAFKDTDNLWKIERNVEVINLEDVSWTYTSYSSEDKAVWCAQPVTNIVGVHQSLLANCISEKYTVSGTNGTLKNVNYIGIINNVTPARIWVSTSAQNIPPSGLFYYELETPTYETLPDSIQAELNALEGYVGTTNIFTDSDMQPNMVASYNLTLPEEFGGTGAKRISDVIAMIGDIGTLLDSFNGETV